MHAVCGHRTEQAVEHAHVDLVRGRVRAGARVGVRVRVRAGGRVGVRVRVRASLRVRV